MQNIWGFRFGLIINKYGYVLIFLWWIFEKE